ncbi:hypothetical protein [Rhizobium sp. Root1220]|uniref:hypothetical protein n=1 Tax=Rhizobium sp. Root1220 TaxID=1736432 RepID=UPI0006FA3F51|nr:hypothetical protein [Rhizobium sp. Root1220]KQV81998.1 hypothetical protein ASC90_24070 [Rhizobium sp. Root1220]
MLNRETGETCRETLSEGFKALSDRAVLSGWPEHEVALVLAELAEAYIVKVSASVIIDGSHHSQSTFDRLKN